MQFPVEVILSVIYGKLLCDIEKVYEILNYMLDDNLYTHQIPRASKFVKQFLLKQHPILEEWKKENEKINSKNWQTYFNLAQRKFGSTLEVQKIPKKLQKHKDPLKELIEMTMIKNEGR